MPLILVTAAAAERPSSSAHPWMKGQSWWSGLVAPLRVYAHVISEQLAEAAVIFARAVEAV